MTIVLCIQTDKTTKCVCGGEWGAFDNVAEAINVCDLKLCGIVLEMKLNASTLVIVY